MKNAKKGDIRAPGGRDRKAEGQQRGHCSLNHLQQRGHCSLNHLGLELKQGFSGSGFLTRVAGNGIAGGTSSKFLGGSFRKGAVLAALTVSASELVTRVNRGVRPTFRTAKGEAVGKLDPDVLDEMIQDGLIDCSKINCDVVNPGVPNAGKAIFVTNGKFVNVSASGIPQAALNRPPGFLTGENGFLSFLARTIPGFNSGSVEAEVAEGTLLT